MFLESYLLLMFWIFVAAWYLVFNHRHLSLGCFGYFDKASTNCLPDVTALWYNYIDPSPNNLMRFPQAYRASISPCYISLDVGNLVEQLTITGLLDLFGHNPNKWSSTNDTVFMFMTPYPPISWRCMSPGLLSSEVQLSPRPGTGGSGRLTICRF